MASPNPSPPHLDPVEEDEEEGAVMDRDRSDEDAGEDGETEDSDEDGASEDGETDDSDEDAVEYSDEDGETDDSDEDAVEFSDEDGGSYYDSGEDPGEDYSSSDEMNASDYTGDDSEDSDSSDEEEESGDPMEEEEDGELGEDCDPTVGGIAVAAVSDRLREKIGELGNGDCASCPICLEPWTADGPHRVCCIPCGHVYGKTCLEKWLQCHQRPGKCPQCNRKFKDKDIITLYAPRVVVPCNDLEKEVCSLRAHNEVLMFQRTELDALKAAYSAEIDAFKAHREASSAEMDVMKNQIDFVMQHFKRKGIDLEPPGPAPCSSADNHNPGINQTESDAPS